MPVSEACKDRIPFSLSSYLTISKILYHFAFGVISYLLGANLLSTLIMYGLWELFQNSNIGRRLYFQVLGIDVADCDWRETLMDNLLFVFGWLAGYMTRRLGFI